jgi:Uma2 family endonuclease
MSIKAKKINQTKQPAIEILQLFPLQGEWTESDYFNLPETNHLVELSEGRLIIKDMPTDEHQKAVLRLTIAINTYIEEHQLGEMRFSPMPVQLWEDKIREPDIIFMSNDHRDRISSKCWGVPDLAIEVVSPSNEDDDRIEKFAEYAKAGISEYWIVDPVNIIIEIYLLKKGKYSLKEKKQAGEGVSSSVLKGFEFAVDELVASMV